MYAKMDKAKGNTGRAAANSVSQRKCNGKQGIGLAGKGPKEIIQRKLPEEEEALQGKFKANKATVQRQTTGG